MMANPSHLEAINGVVIGRVRAEQVEKNDAQCTYTVAQKYVGTFLIVT